MSAIDPESETGNLSGTSDNGSGQSGSGHGSANGSAGSNGSTGGMLARIDNRFSTVPALNWSSGAPSKPEILSAKPTPVELAHAMRRRWALALGLGLLVGGVAAGLVAFFMPVKYEVYALLKVSGRPPAVLDKNSEAMEQFEIFKRTQVQLIRSGTVLMGTLRDKDIIRLPTYQENSDDPAAWLSEQLIIDYPGDSEILRVAIKGKKPEELKKIVDTVVKKYLEEVVYNDKETKRLEEDKIRKSLDDSKRELGKLMDNFKKQQQLLGVNPDQLTLQRTVDEENLRMTLFQVTDLEKELAKNTMEIAVAEAKLEEAQQEKPSEHLIDNILSNDPQVRALTQNLANARMYEESEMKRAKDGAKAKAVVNAHDRVEIIREQIEEFKKDLRPRIEASLAAASSESKPAREMTVPTLKKAREEMEKQLASAKEKFTAQTTAMLKKDVFNSDLETRQQDIAYRRKIVDELQQKLDLADVERMAPERIRPLDKAILATSSGDIIKKYVGLAFAGILGFGIMAVAVAFVEFQSRKINSIEEVNDGLGIPVIGELPNVSGRVWRRMKGGQGPAVLKALMAERIDGTRTAVIHTTAIDPPRVVMVTSAEPHEGKTTTATQLAASLARSGRRTLLIDADIRNPGAHRVFDMPQEPGLCELLRNEVEREAVIHPTRTANLWLLPAGRCDLRSAQALSTSYLGSAIAALAVQYDYLVIDAGPVLKVADPLLVGQHADAAILSVLRDTSKVPKVYEAYERLRSVGITVLGAVVNGVKDDAARHGVELLLAETPQTATAQASTL